MRLIDTHAHLDDRRFEKDRAAVIARCAVEGIGVIAVGADLDSSKAAVTLASKHRGIWAAVGVHPHDAKTATPESLLELERLAANERVIAIGEIGLDYYRDLSPRDVQRSVFARQIELAERRDVPIALHSRESDEDMLRILSDRAESYRGVVHSFLGDLALAEQFLALGLHVGIGGPVTFPRNRALRDAVSRIPLDRIVLETDCPYLTPVPYRGRRNEPAYVMYVAQEIASLKGCDIDRIASMTTRNACTLFGLNSTPPNG